MGEQTTIEVITEWDIVADVMRILNERDVSSLSLLLE